MMSPVFAGISRQETLVGTAMSSTHSYAFMRTATVKVKVKMKPLQDGDRYVNGVYHFRWGDFPPHTPIKQSLRIHTPKGYDLAIMKPAGVWFENMV